MNDIIIRKAQKYDCLSMLELIKELAIYEKAGDEVTITNEEFIDSGFGSNPVWGAFVAEYNNKLVGISIFYIRFSTWKGKRIYLEDIVVTEKLRRQRIGKKLFEATLEYAKNNNFHGMVLQVLDWNELAINFYKKYNVKFDNNWYNVS